jgi:hypothetical protein
MKCQFCSSEIDLGTANEDNEIVCPGCEKELQILLAPTYVAYGSRWEREIAQCVANNTNYMRDNKSTIDNGELLSVLHLLSVRLQLAVADFGSVFGCTGIF